MYHELPEYHQLPKEDQHYMHRHPSYHRYHLDHPHPEYPQDLRCPHHLSYLLPIFHPVFQPLEHFTDQLLAKKNEA